MHIGSCTTHVCLHIGTSARGKQENITKEPQINAIVSDKLALVRVRWKLKKQNNKNKPDWGLLKNNYDARATPQPRAALQLTTSQTIVYAFFQQTGIVAVKSKSKPPKILLISNLKYWFHWNEAWIKD